MTACKRPLPIFAVRASRSLGRETRRLAMAAAEHGIVVVMGINERVDEGAGNRTLYNAILIFDADGELVLHHRKLVPTFTEKLVWGPGDAAGLGPVDTAVGRVGCLGVLGALDALAPAGLAPGW